MKRQRVGDTPAAAEAMAADMLIYLAGRPDDLGRFLALTGIGPAELRAHAQDPSFLAAIADHMLGDEALLLDFARDHDLDPAAIAAARRHLPGWSMP